MYLEKLENRVENVLADKHPAGNAEALAIIAYSLYNIALSLEKLTKNK